MVMKPSRFSFVFKKDDAYAIYHSRLIETLYLNQEGFSVFSQFKNGVCLKNIMDSYPKNQKKNVLAIISNLFDSGLIVLEEDDERRFLAGQIPNSGIDVRIMYVLPTDNCNFECKYCVIESAFPKGHVFTHMSKDTARKGADFFFRISNKESKERRRIIFYGGEPLMNREVVEFSFDYIRNHADSKNTDVSIVTNGSLITPEFARSAKRNNVDISLSLDGPKQVNDIPRVFLKNNNGTFESVIRGYNTLKREGINKVGISLTVGAHNVDKLKDNLELILKDVDVSVIGFNFITDLHDGRNPFSTDINLTTDKVIEAFEFLRQKGIYEDRIMRKLKPFVEKRFYSRDCGAIGNQIVLAPNGDIGPCQAYIGSKKYFSFNVHDGERDIMNNYVFKEWSRRMPMNMPQCLNCQAIGICGGGCPYQAEVTKGSLWELDERMCIHNKKLLEWAIWDAYKQNGTKSNN